MFLALLILAAIETLPAQNAAVAVAVDASAE
jgi:hypothetical protein